jgi:hypothetical protein
MRSILATCAFVAASLAFAGPGAAATKRISCPIGGGAFDYRIPLPPATLGERPDGKPYGFAAPTPLPECPGNGLVLYKDYTSEEAAKIAPLIASDAYKAMLRDDTQYYRAYWLMKQMGIGADEYLPVLLQASWQADGKPELRARYLAELIEESAKVPAKPTDLNWIGMEGRVINALRELGRFDEALVHLEKVPLKALEVAEPAADARTPAAREARKRRAWLNYFREIRPVVERKDASLEPFDMLPRLVALGRCIDTPEKLGQAEKAFCDGQQAAIADLKTARVRQAQELEALKKSREQSGR